MKLEGKLDKREAAEFLGIRPRTLQNWLGAEMGLRHIKYLGRVWFDRKDLEQFKKSLMELRAG